jgi:AraC-like DNA-binding protein
MNSIINEINNTNSEVVYQKDEYGILNEKRKLLPNYGIGSLQVVSFNSWVVQKYSIKKMIDDHIIPTNSKESKFILLNIASQHVINLKSTLGLEIELNSLKGIFIDNNQQSFKITEVNNLELVLIELKESYFEQGLFSLSLQHTIETLFNKNYGICFSLSTEVSDEIDTIMEPAKRGLCQFMFLNGKIFDILSAITDKLTIPSTINEPHLYQKQLNEVAKLINSNLEIQYSIIELSKRVGINTSYLKKFFKEAFNQTIFEYATKQRINCAKKLLINSNQPIANIAEKIGYQQSAHFSHAFKRNTGFSPNQYRKNEKIS